MTEKTKKTHKHWREMALYAQDAAETDQPWERWEFEDEGSWLPNPRHPKWYEDVLYRRKPQSKTNY